VVTVTELAFDAATECVYGTRCSQHRRVLEPGRNRDHPHPLKRPSNKTRCAYIFIHTACVTTAPDVKLSALCHGCRVTAASRLSHHVFPLSSPRTCVGELLFTASPWPSLP
jgi:hypothetical protein